MDWYAAELLGQVPCMRMMDNTGRKRLFNDPGLRGIIALLPAFGLQRAKIQM